MFYTLSNIFIYIVALLLIMIGDILDIQHKERLWNISKYHFWADGIALLLINMFFI